MLSLFQREVSHSLIEKERLAFSWGVGSEIAITMNSIAFPLVMESKSMFI
jgi:hypothetical protein